MDKVLLAQINITAGGSVTKVNSFTLSDILSTVVTAALVISGVIFFFMLLIGGIQWIVSGGDKTGTEAARGRITAALIGLIIVFSAFAIIALLDSIFGFSLLELQFGSIGTDSAIGPGSSNPS